MFLWEKSGFICTGNNDLLSTKLGVFVLREGGNNAGNNGKDLAGF